MTVKIHLEAHGAVVSAEGEVDFVNGVVERWQHLLTRTEGPVGTASRASSEVVSSEDSNNAAADIQYDNVFARHNDRLKIIADIPGTSKAEGTRNAALVLLYGEHLSGAEEVSAERIKEACIDHGCYDNKNFAAHLKSLKPKVVMDPKPGGDYTVKLTAPGRKSAKELVERLNQ
jgi:hypothetical protein